MMNPAIDGCHLNNINFAICKKHTILFDSFHNTITKNRYAFILKIMQLFIFVFEHLVNRWQVDSFSRTE
jgi:hypothetical protein